MPSNLGRTVLLGTLAAAAGIWWLGRAYEVESSRLLGHLIWSLLLVAACIVLAVAAAVLLRLARRRLKGQSATPREDP